VYRHATTLRQPHPAAYTRQRQALPVLDDKSLDLPAPEARKEQPHQQEQGTDMSQQKEETGPWPPIDLKNRAFPNHAIAPTAQILQKGG
jgi:hypothetical protein